LVAGREFVSLRFLNGPRRGLPNPGVSTTLVSKFSETIPAVLPITIEMSGSTDSAQADDVDLVRRAAAGDTNAFGVIFERYQHVVYRFARAMTGSPDLAEDVAQEVFVILMQELKRYDPDRATLSTYLYGVARNVSRDRLRRQRRLLLFWSPDLTQPDETPRADPFQRMVTEETGGEIRRALARVPVKLREVVILCDLHDLSYADAGTALGISTHAVRSRLHRGRQLLRRRLSPPERPDVRRAAGSSISDLV
jgi:RNA polymerase sigma factor (sigma-70 family)